MTPLVPLTMFGWIPVVIGVFSRLNPRHAVIAAFLIAWLFLPIATYSLPGIPDYTKMSATCWGVFLAAFLFDSRRLLQFKPGWVDVPMFIWCLCPLVSSLSNGLGLYDGIATVFRQTVTWGFPYLIGRLYLSDLAGMRAFAIAIVLGGVAYIPLCLVENLISPQLHNWLYGYHQHDFSQTFRWGGWRPMVFMDHGLMVGVWMMSACLLSFWLWISGSVRTLLKVPMPWVVACLFFTALMTRSTGAWALLFGGTAILLATKKLKKRFFIFCLLAIPFLYIGTRATGIWSGYNLQIFIAEHISVDRAISLWTRMENENILAQKAAEKAVFGWGGWGRSRVYDDAGNDISVTDGLWIIVYGENGLVGLGALALAIILPAGLFLKRFPVSTWSAPLIAPAACTAVLLGLYMVDNLLNAMINPIFILAAGGLAGVKKKVNFSSTNRSEPAAACDMSSAPRFL